MHEVLDSIPCTVQTGHSGPHCPPSSQEVETGNSGETETDFSGWVTECSGKCEPYCSNNQLETAARST